MHMLLGSEAVLIFLLQVALLCGRHFDHRDRGVCGLYFT
jgi:hypothetical protein